MIYNIKSQNILSGFYIVYKSSVNNEYKGVTGLSHFIEHLKYKSSMYMLEELERNSITANATTSMTDVRFFLQGIGVDKFVDEFHSNMNKFKPTYEEFEQEKSIVISEYQTQAAATQGSIHMHNLHRYLFNNYLPIGSVNDIQNYSYEECMQFHNDNFTEPYSIVNISKNSKYVNNVRFNTEIVERDFLPDSDVELIKNKFKKSNTTSIIFTSPIFTKDVYISNFITVALGAGLNSPLYKIVRLRDNLTYGISCFLLELSENKYVIHITLEVDNKNVNKALNSIVEVIENYEIHLSEDRFDNIKYKKNIELKEKEVFRYTSIKDIIYPNYDDSQLEDLTYEKFLNVYKKTYNLNNWYISTDKNEKYGR